MRCVYGGEITFTLCEPHYRLRIVTDHEVAVLLTADEARLLHRRICEVLVEAAREEDREA